MIVRFYSSFPNHQNANLTVLQPQHEARGAQIWTFHIRKGGDFGRLQFRKLYKFNANSSFPTAMPSTEKERMQRRKRYAL